MAFSSLIVRTRSACKMIDEIDKHLLNDFQRGFPLCSRPYLEVANRLGIDENEVIGRLSRLKDSGHVSRIGAIVKPGSIGASTLAALQVDEDKIEQVASYINARDDVNHNYLREHDYNMWFVLNTSSKAALDRAVQEIEEATGLQVLVLRMLKDFHLDLGFDLKWHS
ncbi:Lrp/AsnC family transcriptional regulator [Terasakiella brassicae]|nr:AsnC family transcriptional regulator [Terasakiella brassicae]